MHTPYIEEEHVAFDNLLGKTLTSVKRCLKYSFRAAEPFIVLWTANVVSSGGTLYRPCLFVYGCSVTPLPLLSLFLARLCGL